VWCAWRKNFFFINVLSFSFDSFFFCWLLLMVRCFAAAKKMLLTGIYACLADDGVGRIWGRVPGFSGQTGDVSIKLFKCWFVRPIVGISLEDTLVDWEVS